MAGVPHQAVGLRRVAWVRLTTGAGVPVAEAFGISHRLPRIHRVSLAAAADLARRGVPLVVRRAAEGDRDAESTGPLGPTEPSGPAEVLPTGMAV